MSDSPIRAYLSALGKKGGKARAAALTPGQRSRQARKAIQARWAKRDRELAALKKGA